MFDPVASEVIRQRVDVIQSGFDGEAAQEVFRVKLVEVYGQFSDTVLLWLPEARKDLKRTVNQRQIKPFTKLQPQNKLCAEFGRL